MSEDKVVRFTMTNNSVQQFFVFFILHEINMIFDFLYRVLFFYRVFALLLSQMSEDKVVRHTITNNSVQQSFVFLILHEINVIFDFLYRVLFFFVCHMKSVEANSIVW